MPFSFDVDRLCQDLEIAEKYQFSKHPLSYHDGTWSAINLIYAGGQIAYTHEGDLGYGEDPPQSTEVLDACPYFKEVLEQIPGEKLMARLSALPPRGKILRHYDPVESVDFGQLRLHIPIRNNPSEVVFRLGFRRQFWRPGELWYGDFTFPHSVFNNSCENRVNMIVDVAGVEPFRDYFPKGYLGERSVRHRDKLRKHMKNVTWQLNKLRR